MSRDMKPRTREKSGTRKGSGGGTLVGLFVGLVVGVLVAASVVWYIHRTPPPFSAKTQAPSAPPQAGQAPLALPGKPGDPTPGKPRFDFYEMLPKGNGGGATPEQVAIAPSAANPPTEAAKPADPGKDALKDPVFLQTGSFQNAADADNQKARLAMAGMEAAIQQVMLQDKVWYRVRLGPFKRIEDVNALRAELARQGVEANIVRKD